MATTDYDYTVAYQHQPYTAQLTGTRSGKSTNLTAAAMQQAKATLNGHANQAFTYTATTTSANWAGSYGSVDLAEPEPRAGVHGVVDDVIANMKKGAYA